MADAHDQAPDCRRRRPRHQSWRRRRPHPFSSNDRSAGGARDFHAFRDALETRSARARLPCGPPQLENRPDKMTKANPSPEPGERSNFFCKPRTPVLCVYLEIDTQVRSLAIQKQRGTPNKSAKPDIRDRKGCKPHFTAQKADETRRSYADRAAKWTVSALAQCNDVTPATINNVLARRGAYRSETGGPQ